MRANPSPTLDDDLGFAQRVEDLAIEKFVGRSALKQRGRPRHRSDERKETGQLRHECAAAALGAIFAGAPGGGPMAAFAPPIANNLGAKRVPNEDNPTRPSLKKRTHNTASNLARTIYAPWELDLDFRLQSPLRAWLGGYWLIPE